MGVCNPQLLVLNSNHSIDTTHNLAIAASLTVLDTLGAKRKPTLAAWTTCILMVNMNSLIEASKLISFVYAALGITDEVEQLSLRGTKKKKGRKLDEDFIVRPYLVYTHINTDLPIKPVLSPIEENQVASVCNAIRRASSSNQKMLPHLLVRLKVLHSALNLDYPVNPPYR